MQAPKQDTCKMKPGTPRSENPNYLSAYEKLFGKPALRIVPKSKLPDLLDRWEEQQHKEREEQEEELRRMFEEKLVSDARERELEEQSPLSDFDFGPYDFPPAQQAVEVDKRTIRRDRASAPKRVATTPEQMLHDEFEQQGITRDKLVCLVEGGTSITHGMEIDPFDYVLLCNEDFERGGDARFLNCIVNAKRAIYCQVDAVLRSIKMLDHASKMPERMKLVAEMGFYVPSTVWDVVELRNKLEHEHRRPLRPEVERAIATSTIFVENTARAMRAFNHDVKVGVRTGNKAKSRFEWAFSITFDEYFRADGEPSFSVTCRDSIGPANVGADDPLFVPLVALVNGGDVEWKASKAIDRIFEVISGAWD